MSRSAAGGPAGGGPGTAGGGARGPLPAARGLGPALVAVLDYLKVGPSEP
jgi:hypothetical protein